MKLLDNFINLNHKFFFELVQINTLAEQVKKIVDQKDVSGKEIYLYHSDPIKFSLFFLYLIDQGAAPICLQSAKAPHGSGWHILEDQWIGEFVQNTLYKNPYYSVLTSGTVNHPKRCDFSIENAISNARAHSESFEMSNDLEIIQTLPVYHSFGIIAYIFTPLVLKTSINYCVGLVGSKLFSKYDDSLKLILHTSPAQARFMLKEKNPPPRSLKKLTIGGGAISFKELKLLSYKFPQTEFYVSYGLTEAGPRVLTGKLDTTFLDTLNISDHSCWIGTPLNGVEIRTSNNLTNNGQLQLKSPYLKLNINIDEQTEDGWFLTRDQVCINHNNAFFLSRSEDLIKCGGISIYPNDVEYSVRNWPEVTNAILLKKQDLTYDEIPYLFIEGTITESKANELLVKEINYSHLIKKIIILDSFPKMSLDKIDRKKLYDFLG